ncbi:S-layer homology domain-containing protein [Lysinibacillus pakistanensis]|uniref:S-layer homology domain-containing protein n=1 Tax=Lysinibacillus pakistanensis TaxID=759811 RepID=A0AAX3X0U4_9BACI|nr:S-layer homology domain-containing protein [Lysinibacillus pakistanensis]MDM5231749.1 S-layer homology domain-containing protein [Lysinibacillus pakistanensis]WHY47288.1 S-layer homology domain-containing protein [Lysinibacillus pakistanensis]WHY52297.1 S-layer homology domain-containing protein [Lysinibacillus pakistanensis]
MANQPKKYKKFVATAATATLVASAIVPVASAAGFTDVENNTHKDAINALSDAGIINGYADGTFKPNQTINRGQVVKLLGRWLETEGFEIPSDWETSQRFKDLPLTAEKELVKYAALAKDAGVFAGSNGNLNYTQSMQRQQMAVVLVRAINEIYDLDLIAEYKEAGFKSEISDLGAAFSAEQREAITALEYAELTNAANLPGKAFKPADSITRGQFASFLYRTINLDIAVDVDATVKAINNTTVEVTFDEEVGNIKDLDFKIEGLEVKNAAVKQSNKKVVVLTTAAQEVGKEYTVTLNGEEIGKFKGVEAVIPTAIDIVEKSQQEVVGNQVTVKAKVTVAEGQSKEGIPVTFNIINNYGDNSTGTLNQPIIAEATTNADGVATYTYTRYAQTSQQIASSDEVQAYSTGKASVRSFAKVYWASIKPLTITELTTGNSVNNGAKKQYKIKAALYHTEGYTAAFTENGQVYPAGNYVNIAYKENIDVAPDKAVKTVDVIDAYGKNLGYPAQFTTSLGDQNQGIKVVKIPVDKNGEAIVTLTGSNAELTPIVFVDNKENPQNATGNRGRFNPTELFAEAPKLTFGKIQNLQLTLDSIGTEYAAAYIGSLNSNVSTYTYENAAGDKLYRDGAGHLAILANNAALPANATLINQNNPLRAGEIVPAGFTQKFVNTNVTVPGFNSLFSATKSVHTYYNIANGDSASKQLADALFNAGGRDYKAVLKDEKGNLAPTGTQVRVSVEIGSGVKTNSGPVYLVDKNSNSIHRLTENAYNVNADKVVVNLATNAKGEVAFTLIGAKDAYATPTVFTETGDKAGLDKNDLQQVGGIAYFGDAIVKSATLTVDGKDEKTVSVGDLAAFTYQTVDQNNKPYNTYNQSNLRVTFQFTSTFAGAEVYAAKDVVNGKLVAGAKPIGYVNMGSANTSPFPVDAVDGKATVYVKATRGTTVTATASANTPSLPQNLTASAVFNLSNNEGVQPGVPVTGKVIATDLENNRLLLLLNDGVTVRDVDYSGANTQFYKGGSLVNISEQTFESNNGADLLGKEVTFTLAKDSTPTTVKNSDISSSIKFKDGAKIHLTNPNATYDFQNLTTNSVGNAEDNTTTPPTKANKVDIYVNADNVTIKNANVFGNITVGGQGSSSDYQDQKTVRKFTADNVTLNGNAYVHTNAKETFNLVNGSVFERVILEKDEKVELKNASKIGELVVKTSASIVAGDGTGTINFIATVGSANLPSIVTNALSNTPVTAETLTSVVTTSGDTVTLTFATGSNLIANDISVTDGTTTGRGTVNVTSADAATVTFTSPVASKTLYVALTKNGVTKEYSVVVNPTIGGSGTITRKY